jgi:dihydroorotate dehydrogenase
MLSYSTFKKILFKIDPERSHDLVRGFLGLEQSIPPLSNWLRNRNTVTSDALSQDIFGKRFVNPVGLAAGFDKNGTVIRGMASLGFGFIEIGTVTPLSQEGNPKPRVFRFPEEESIQNAMGFPNDGMKEIFKRVKRVYPSSVPLGVNIGKNKATPQGEAIRDYEQLIDTFKDVSDYMVVNISSPNTPGLRDLQNERFVADLFDEARKMTSKPVLLKIAPDMDPLTAVHLCAAAIENGAAGIIATNTSVDYSLLPNAKDFGGISGRVMGEKSFAILDAVARELYGKTVLISAGGIDSGREAYRRIKAGASLVQIYTALVFHGPSLVRRINLELLELLKKDGFRHIRDAIGVDRR